MSSPIEQMYDRQPYPVVPIELSMRDKWTEQFKMHWPTAQYVRTHEWASSEGKRLLNAGCGTGLETLILAEANPGASIVAIDFSAASVKVAEQRLRFHGFRNVEFHVMDLLAIADLGYAFDLITCSDTLYLLDDPVAGLQALRDVLHSDGILRANLHNHYNRRDKLEVQEALRLLGLGDLPLEKAVQRTREVMGQVRPSSWRKMITWIPEVDTFSDDLIVNNFLLRGDKAYTIPETLAMLQAAHLDLVSLVDVASWDLNQVFQTVPESILPSLEGLSSPEVWHLCELLYPNLHRLIDFWAEHRGSSLVLPWDPEDWQYGRVHLHPLLASNATFHQLWQSALTNGETLIFDWLGVPSGRMQIPYPVLAWLHPLCQGSRPTQELLATCPTDHGLEDLMGLEVALFVLLEPEMG
ncbi:MAG: class I SAM-dependent methyltransferase [Synechococcales cyanobacterium]